MADKNLPERWLRGPVPGVPALLQPVAHALLQASDEVTTLLQDFDNALLWKKPAGAASVGFHLQHLAGVIDRLFTYAQGNALSQEQLTQLRSEGIETDALLSQELVGRFQAQVQTALEQLRQTPEGNLTDDRKVGRAGLPSTTLGLLVHAAEHTMRHTGQLLVTVKVLRSGLL